MINIEKINENTYLCDGYKFTKSTNKKYYRNTTLKTDLHRYIWNKTNGEIPKGFHIHHIDKDTENNCISNLECINGSEHLKKHMGNLSEETKVLMRGRLLKVNELSKEWHKSEEGKKWHKEHYEKNKDKMFVEVKKICQCCLKEYVAYKNDSKFCSNSCKSKSRRDSKVDNIIKICLKCGKEFSVNKYSKINYCSRSCSKTK